MSIAKQIEAVGEDVAGLKGVVLYGLKGMAAYADHARILGEEDDDVYAFFHETLDFLTRNGQTAEELLGAALKVGEVNLTVMGLLDAANTGASSPSTVLAAKSRDASEVSANSQSEASGRSRAWERTASVRAGRRGTSRQNSPAAGGPMTSRARAALSFMI